MNNNLKKYQTIIILIIIHACLLGLLGMSVESRALSNAEDTLESIDSKQAKICKDNVAVIQVNDGNNALAVIRGNRNNSRSKLFGGNNIQVFYAMAVLSASFFLIHKKRRFYDVLSVWGSYILILMSYIHSKDGSKSISMWFSNDIKT